MQMDDSAPPELPPTLFKLPNLKPGGGKSVAPVTAPPALEQPEMASQTVAVSEPSAATEAAGRQPAPKPYASGESNVLAETPNDLAISRSEPERDQSSSVSRGYQSEKISPYAEPAQTPAGRTWMERISSHALVLVMLLIVVAAAMITGRGPNDPSELDDSVANENREIQFDDSAVELPMPDHAHQKSTPKLVQSVEPAAPTGRSTEDVKFKLASDGSPSLMAQANLNTEPAAPLPEVTVSLEPAADEVAAPATRIEANKIVQDTDGTEAQMVSAREDVSAVPTLEELESAIQPETEVDRGPDFSNTPFGITDATLLRQLDQLINEMSAAQQAGDLVYPNPNN